MSGQPDDVGKESSAADSPTAKDTAGVQADESIGDEPKESTVDNAPQGTPPGWYPDPTFPGQQRYWDGSSWSDKTAASDMPVSTTRRTADERKAMLAQQIQQAVGRGLRIESQSDFQTVLVEGKPVNHTLHAILTIFTCLLWGIVWAVIAGTGGEKREMIVVDEFGNVQHQKLGRA